MCSSGDTEPPPRGAAPDGVRGEITDALHALRAGEEGAGDRLIAAVHAHLRRIARGYLKRERAGHTLDPTAILHEAYLRLFGDEVPALENRRHLYGAFARAVRQVLIDHARKRDSVKRGAGWHRVTMTGTAETPTQAPIDILALHQALERLAALDERRAQIVELRFFGGLSVPEVAETLGVGTSTVDREWAQARAWLQAELTA